MIFTMFCPAVLFDYAEKNVYRMRSLPFARTMGLVSSTFADSTPHTPRSMVRMAVYTVRLHIVTLGDQPQQPNQPLKLSELVRVSIRRAENPAWREAVGAGVAAAPCSDARE